MSWVCRRCRYKLSSEMVFTTILNGKACLTSDFNGSCLMSVDPDMI